MSSSLVTAADDGDDEDADEYVDEYDIAPAASLFVAFRNQFGPYRLVP